MELLAAVSKKNISINTMLISILLAGLLFAISVSTAYLSGESENGISLVWRSVSKLYGWFFLLIVLMIVVARVLNVRFNNKVIKSLLA
ncbi:MAG: hypothetical protein COB81_04990 [Flavobacteriaceae bacterium]|nr:MAG: hypothetical protein COB81_04990 [Flavobacteriaceae bacterium]